jgi:hypothetical protein
MRTFLTALLFGAAISIAAAQSSLPARAYYLAADVCGTEASSQYLLLHVGQNSFDFAGHPPTITSSCPTGGTVKTVNTFSTNSTAMSLLNSFTNNCQTRVFWDLLGSPYSGVAPAGSRILVFTSANPDLSVFNSTSFADLCGGAPVLVVFGNYSGTDPFFYNNHPYLSGCGNYSIAEIGFGTDKQTIQYNPALLAAQDGAYVGVETSNVIRYGQASGCTCPGLSCSSVVSVQFSGDLSICEGDRTQITADAGAGYTYLWSTGATGNKIDVTPNITTSYYVTVTNSAMPQCAATAKVTVDVFKYPAVNLATEGENSGPACYGQKAYLRIGFQQPSQTSFTYTWTPPNPSIVIAQDESVIINEQTAGTYSLTIQYANGCAYHNQSDLSFPVQNPVKVCTNAPVCTGGTATLIASAPGTIFAWSGPGNYSATGNTQEILNPTAGIYQVTVTDENGCTSTGSTAILVNNCTVGPLTVLLTPSATTCGQGNGAINLTAFGGTSPYTYDWAHVTGTNNPSSLTGLTAGTYTVTATDGEGATATATVAVIGSTGISLALTPTGTSCGNNNGAITAVVSSGTAPYTYDWLDITTGTEPQNRGALAAGNYSVTITDVSGCTAGSSATISSSAGASVSAVITGVSCSGGNNGAINVTVGGGSAPYTYNWADITSGVEPEDRSNLIASTYNLTVTAANGCTATISAQVQQPVPLTNSAVSANAACGLPNGSITVTTTGGTSPYTFDWADLSGTNDPQNRTAINGGTYTVTITDLNSCTGALSRTIQQPGVPGLTAALTHVSCFGGTNGTINITITGGTSPYSYNWADLNIANEPKDRTGLTAGTYSITVTDVQGCTQSGSYTITQPASALALSAAFTNATCGNTNGTITLTVSGGTSAYTYNWADITTAPEPKDRTGLAPGTYSVTVTDANSCTTNTAVTITQPGGSTLSAVITNVTCLGSFNGAINVTVTGGASPYTYNWADITTGTEPEDRTGLGAGTYALTVTTSSGCTTSGSWTVTQPTILSITSSFTNTSCGLNNGAINTAGSGGTSPYTYNWSHIAGTNDPQNLTGVSAGTYGLTVTDNNGCTKTNTFTINSSTVVSVTVTKTNTSCGNNNGSITLGVSGGGGSSYSFDWAHIAGTANNQNLTSLPPGVYNVTVTATATGCTSTKSSTVNSSVGVTVTGTLTHTTCLSSNGAIALTVSGSSSPYTYQWSNGSTTQNVSGLLHETNYTVTVTSSSGCSTVKTYTIVNTTFPPTINGTVVNASGGNNGSITLSITNGTAPYSFLWNNSATTQNLSGLAPNTYTVTVTTASPCTSSRNFTVLPSNLTNPNNGNQLLPNGTEEDDSVLSATNKSLEDREEIKVFPNPASESFVLAIPNSFGWCNIEIYDALSRQIMQLKGEGQMVIKSGSWASGMYTINVLPEKAKFMPGATINVIIK